MIRSGIVEIGVEYHDTIILRHVRGDDSDLFAGREIEPHWVQIVCTKERKNNG